MTVLESAYAGMLGVARIVPGSDPGRCTMRFDPKLLGRPGFLHGGAIAALLALACDDAVGADARCFTSTFQFLRGASERDLHVAVAIARGATIATVTATAWQDDEQRPVATGSRKYLLSNERSAFPL